jgi:hypothetical protein
MISVQSCRCRSLASHNHRSPRRHKPLDTQHSTRHRRAQRQQHNTCRAITITLTSDIQRRQCRVHTQCTAQRLAASRADLVVCSHTTTTTDDDARQTPAPCTASATHVSRNHNHTHGRHPATSVSNSHTVHRSTTRSQPRRSCCLLSHNHNDPR